MNTDEFGGIAIEDTDEFGGIAVAEENVTSSVTEKPLTAETLNIPNLLPGGMNDPGDPREGAFTQALFKEAPAAAAAYVGNIARAIPADLAAGFRADPEQSGNIPAAITGSPMPIDKALGEAALEDAQQGNFPTSATVGQVSQGLAAMAPLAAIGFAPATIQRLAALGFSIDMIGHAPELFKDYAEEINKPKEEQDPDKVAKLTSGIMQTFAFAPLAGKHGVSGVPVSPLNPKFDARAGFSPPESKSPEVVNLERSGAPLTAKVVEATKPLNLGGALKDLPPELQQKSNAVKDAMAAEFERLKSEQPPSKKVDTTKAEKVGSKAVEATPKEYWEMTQQEFTDWWQAGGADKLPAFQAHSDPRVRALPRDEFFANERRSAINWSLRQGKEVPPEVLKDYPELQSSPKPTEPEPAGEVLSPERPEQPSKETTPPPPVEATEKVRVGKNPTPHTVVEKLPQTPVEKANNEQSVRVKNDRTGEVSVVDQNSVTPIREVPASEKVKTQDPNKFQRGEVVNTSKYGQGKVVADMGKRVKVDFGDGNKFSVDRADLTRKTPVESKPADIISKLESLKFKEKPGGQLYSLPHPDALAKIGKQLWNDAIDVAIASVKAGKAIRSAIDDALAHIKSKSPAYDEIKLRDNLESQFGLEPPPTTPGTLGESQRMRNLSARGTKAPEVPEAVQKQIAEDPRSIYPQQNLDAVKDVVSKLSDSELAGVGRDSDIYTAAKLEQANRQFKAGNNAAGYEIFQELSADLTRMGQVINQAKLLQGLMPENTVKLVNEGLRQHGKDPLTEKQSKELKNSAERRIELERELSKATEAWEKKPTEENAKKAEKALKESNDAALKEQRLVHRYQNRSMWGLLKAILQGNLLTPISQVANLVGNVSFLPFRAGARGIATAIDMVDSYLRNRPREITIGNTRASIKGALESSKKIPDILLRGTDEALKGETRVGLHPLRAWATQLAKEPKAPTKGGKLATLDRAKLAIEGTFGATAEPMLRGLGAGDQPFRGAARGRLIAEQAKLKGIPKDQWEMAQKFPELFFDEKILKQINEESLAAVFQRRSQTLNHLLSWIKTKGDAFDFMVSTLIPYKVTPWNIVGEILSFVPPVSLGRAAIAAKQGKIRQAEMNLGKAVVGGIMMTTAMWLYKKGLIAPSLDAQDEQAKARLLSNQVLPPNHLNVSGLKRALAGGDPAFKPGDETVDFFRGGGLMGSFMYLSANVGRDMEKNPESDNNVQQALGQSVLEGARFTLNQSFLKGTATLLEAVQEGNADTAIRAWFNSLESIPFPNTLNAISRANREFQVDARPEKFIDKMINPLKMRLGVVGTDDQMTLKRGLWGEPLRETPKDANALFYHFFDISKNRQVTDDALNLELYRLWRKTADTGVIPTPPAKTITDGGTTYVLTPAQQGKYQEIVGKERRRLAEPLVVNPGFAGLPDAEKIELIEWAYREGHAIGKLLFISENPDLKPKGTKSGFKEQ